MQRLQHHRRAGNTFVESALVFIPLMALILGIADFAFAHFLRVTMQHAVREGTRYAITYQLQPGKCQDASIKDIVTTQAMGFLNGATKQAYIKVRYYNPLTFTELTSSTANSPGNLVEVSVEGYPYSWMAPLLFTASPFTITVRSSDRLEGLGAGASAPCK
ncbi:MAG: pilus assembly protein [Bryobacterales bacterium]|nr:pilus assembly protein [Bryobacterales bacterium]